MINEAEIPKGATPLDPDEAAGLKPGLTTGGELNAFEQANIAQAGESPFTWGGTSIDFEGHTRTNYLNALRSADKGNYKLLIAFANQD